MLITKTRRELYKIILSNGRNMFICISDKLMHCETFSEKKQLIIDDFNSKIGMPIAVNCKFYGYINEIDVNTNFLSKGTRKFVNSANDENNN